MTRFYSVLVLLCHVIMSKPYFQNFIVVVINYSCKTGINSFYTAQIALLRFVTYNPAVCC